MLVVRVDVWPGGRQEDAREIGRAGFANLSALAEVSDYLVVILDDRGFVETNIVSQHCRRDGFWPLLARGFSQEDQGPLPDALAALADVAFARLRAGMA